MTPGASSRVSNPGIRYLNASRLNRALRAGIERVLAERVHLNRINVFPVPDGDTGTNLAFTAASISTVLLEKPPDHVGQLLIRVADAALDGARGNSGAILAQFLQGMADELADEARIEASQLIKAFDRATDYARSALESPQEGTILTVMADLRDALSQQYRDGETDLVKLLDAGLARSRLSLEATRHGLEAMRRADVVDAGASGFVSLLSGVVDFLHSGSLRAVPTPMLDDPDVFAERPIAGTDDEVQFRYCTECIVTAERIDRRKLREGLAALGNSLVIAGTRRKIKVHLHTDHPDQAFAFAGHFGQVGGQKADDMRRQTSALRSAGPRVAIVTDSAADLPDEAYETLGIHVVPLRVQFGERSYLDKLGLSADEFFAELRTAPEPPQTSQPAPGDFRRLYEFLVSHFDRVISISLSAKLSGTWRAAVAAAERVRGLGEVTVVDSRNVSLGQGLIVIHAAECAQAGYSPEQLIAAVKASMRRTLTIGLVPDLSYAVRGGRIGTTTHLLVDRLQIAPLIRVTSDGRVRVRGAVPRQADPVDRLSRYLRRRMRPGRAYRLAVGHADAPELAQRLEQSMRKSRPDLESVYIAEIGAALAVHMGPGSLGAAIQEYHPPEPPSG